MRALVTGATGFLGAHVARLLAERGDDVRVTFRDADRLERLGDVRYEPVEADALDLRQMRRAVRRTDVVLHTAGLVASSPEEKVFAINGEAPRIAVEAAAKEGVRRVVITSSVSAIGPAPRGEVTDEERPDPGETGVVYADSKRAGDRAALEAGARLGVEVVVACPAYVLGVPVDRSEPGETSTRTVGNYLLGRLPAVLDAGVTFCDVVDVARGHLQAAERGRAGERYILGGTTMTWPELIDRLADLSGIRHPVAVLPSEVEYLARAREALGLPGLISSEAFSLMAGNWSYSSRKARRELGYTARPLDRTLRETIDWYLDLTASGAFDDRPGSTLSALAGVLRASDRFGALGPLRLAERIVGRRFLAGV